MSTEESLAKIAEYLRKIETDLDILIFTIMIVAIAFLLAQGR